ncbi:MAG: DUF6612 family protein [Eubacteriales bacterium]
MKKILAPIIAICALIMLTACNSSEKIYEVYSTGIEKFNQLDSLDMIVDVNMDMELNGETLKIPMNMILKSKSLNSDPEYLVNTSMTILDTETTSQVYYKGGYVYLSASKNKYKQEMSLDDMKNNYAVVNVDLFDKELLEKARLTKTEHGSTITLSLSGEKIEDKLTSMFFNMDTLLENFGGISSFKFGNLSATLSYNTEGYLTSEVIKYDISCTADNTPLNANVKCAFNINNPGKEVTITPPDDLDSYISIT